MSSPAYRQEWTIGDLVERVLGLGEPSERVDRMIDLTVGATLRGEAMGDALFKSWAPGASPPYTSSVEDVRRLASTCGIRTDSAPLSYGFVGRASGAAGGEEQEACGFNAAAAEAAALLIVLRMSVIARRGLA